MVVIVEVFLQDAIQLATILDKHMIQALPPQAANEALTERIRPGCPHGRLQYLDTTGHSCKPLPILAIPVVIFRPIISQVFSPKVYHQFSPKCYQ
jgi:hypothetical protein